MHRRSLEIYTTQDGRAPFEEWLRNLRDITTRNRILRRIDRLELGNFGDHKRIGSDLLELRLHFGSGYRVYFAEIGDVLLLILYGGDKGSQTEDIKRARIFLTDYLSRCPP